MYESERLDGLVRFVEFGDYDSDGFVDAIYKNQIGFVQFGDGANFGERISLADLPPRASVDVDGDGDLDELLSDYFAGVDLTWREAFDGGTTKVHTIADRDELAAFVVVHDIDGDGDPDVVAGYGVKGPITGAITNRIQWFENDGSGNFAQHVLEKHNATDFHPHSLHVADLDNDGDLDFTTNLGWYENTDGLGDFQLRTIGDFSPHAVTDVDGDGDLDLIVESYFPALPKRELGWSENLDGKGTFSVQRTIDGSLSSWSVVKLFDVGGDGDMDLFLGHFGLGAYDTRQISWYENTDGRGQFGREQLIVPLVEDSLPSFDVGDIESDGHPDLIVGQRMPGFVSRVELIRSDGLVEPGDSNFDGRFDSADLVTVFQAGEYEDVQNGNSTFEEGDWNGDGDFNSSDLVYVFQLANYVAASRPISSFAMSDLLDRETHRKKRVDHDVFWSTDDDWWTES